MNSKYSLDKLVEVFLQDTRGQIGRKILGSVSSTFIHKEALNKIFMRMGRATMNIQSHTEDELRIKIKQLA
jgi:hypothetical protein